MADEKFDIIFCGELSAGADRVAVQKHLKRSFGLSDDALQRLFQGRPVSIKRGVAAGVATRYRRLFLEAGALIRIDPVAQVPDPDSDPDPEEQTAPVAADGESSVGGASTLSLSTETGYLEESIEQPPPDLDLSYLSLETSEDWSLEDCEPLPLPTPLTDISHLSLVEPGKSK